jgi:photosystem II stability/assembly factor-like uncharacterized protein
LVAPAAWFGARRLHAANPSDNGWKLVYDRPAVGKYEDFAFPDDKNGWLISASGFILHTSDGGTTWSEQTKGLSGLRSIDFIDKKRGFAGSLNAKLYATVDGGDTWNEISSTLPHQAQGYCGITHVGQQVHIVGKYIGNATDYYYSPDAGKTWRYENLNDSAQALVDVRFLSDKVGLIGGMGKSAALNQGSAMILKTTDGGLHWHVVFHNEAGRGYAWKFFPITSKLIYAGLQSEDGVYRAVKTLDGGDHWDTLTVATGLQKGHNIQGIGFIDAKTGWVGGWFKGMWTTTDGGKSWTNVDVPDAIINRFERVGNSLFTAGSRGILRYDIPKHR